MNTKTSAFTRREQQIIDTIKTTDMTYAEIGAEYGYSGSSIGVIARKAGISRYPGTKASSKTVRILEDVKAGMPYKEIAEKHQVRYCYVSAVAVKNGIRIRRTASNADIVDSNTNEKYKSMRDTMYMYIEHKYAEYLDSGCVELDIIMLNNFVTHLKRMDQS